MSDNYKIVEIKDKKYILEPFLGKKGFKIKQKVVRILAPVLKEVGTLKEENTILEYLAVAVQSVMEHSDDDSLFNLIEELLTGAKTESGKIDFDTEFSQNYVTLYKLVAEIVLYNYKDVFSELGMNVG